ncbi:ArsR/SmtB family transcription factor [Nocardioides sp. LHG3406-4]|uniref:ArsR/SmtB family transcription factor n=1 Tax=Nocardioides sp. LHG3406-4 TaxID=2804575 RepID=UPI003CFB0145
MPSSLPVLQPAELAACCSPVTAGIVSDETAETLARMFKALSDPTRVKLLSMIAAAPDGEACICDMTEPVGLSQPTVSHHMKLLVEAGLVTREQRGKWAFYRAAPDVLRSLAAALNPTNTAG